MNYKKLIQVLDAEQYSVWDTADGKRVGVCADLAEAQALAQRYVEQRIESLDRGFNHMFVMNPPADVTTFEMAKDKSIVGAYMYFKKGDQEPEVQIKKGN